MTTTKTLRKTNEKTLKSFQGLKNKYTSDKDDESCYMISLLREVIAVTMVVFEPLLYFISGSKAQSKPSDNWPLLSKLMHGRRIACEAEASVNEFVMVDAALCSSKGSETEETTKIENLQSKMLNLDLCVQDLEGL
ncbi:uncharacterized protein LOC110819088 [Carica papaya]|uniref:uncharacterized protein LOC110819088 n=1 Tax=Carica papaya TaxID=3649 RepID=UPI000B8CEEFB|nr:uncharacterized protein LOC110819088 [Carica papaya]